MLLEVLRFTLRYNDTNYQAGKTVEVDDATATQLLTNYPENYRAATVSVPAAAQPTVAADTVDALPAVDAKKTVK